MSNEDSSKILEGLAKLIITHTHALINTTMTLIHEDEMNQSTSIEKKSMTQKNYKESELSLKEQREDKIQTSNIVFCKTHRLIV